MKNIFLSACLVIAVISTSASRAEELLNGCKITESPLVEKEKESRSWIVISKDNEGTLRKVTWMKHAEAGTFTNQGDYDKTSFQIKASPAVAACEKKKMALPTKQEYDALKNCFEADKADTKFLSEKGLHDLHAKFADLKDLWFWTSTAYNYYAEGDAMYFYGAVGGVEHGAKTNQYSVRCVTR